MRTPWLTVIIAALALCLSPARASAQPTPAATSEAPAAPTSPSPEEQALERAREFEASLRYESGDVTLGGGLASVRLGDDYRYLDPAQTSRVLQAWGNPANERTLGLIVPTGESILAEDAWAVVVTSSDDGHINDDDADEINYDEVLEEMKRDARTASQQRVAQGLQGYTLLGWAERPHYDRATHILYWAKEVDFGGPDHTLNYAMRVLGRTGVLELNAVAPMRQLAMVRGRMEGLRQRVTFSQGRQYRDFVPSADRVAAYGLGALVAGKVLAKVGLFKGLIALLIAGKKLVVAGLVALGTALRSFLGKKQPAGETPPPDGPPPGDPAGT